MLAKNYTPFAALGFEQVHKNGQDMATIMCRGSFELTRNGKLTPVAADVVLADEYEGDPAKTSLVMANDLAPFKPNTDITVVGFGYAPDNKPARTFEFGLSINKNSRILRGYGPRRWTYDSTSDTWQLTEPDEVDRIPLDYCHAAGSGVLGGKIDPHGANPIGIHRLDRDKVAVDQSYPAPLIADSGVLIKDPFVAHEPLGFGPIPPTWHSRARHIGTTDKTWRKERYPMVPKDFSYLFYQCAHPSMWWSGFFHGDEEITLHRLVRGGDTFKFRLPAIQPVANFFWQDGRRATARLNLDGLHIDLRSLKEPWRVHITWRGWAVICPQFFKIDLSLMSLTEASQCDLLGCNENGLYEVGRS